MITSIETEIMELHQFFTDWFTGHIENSDTAFNRCVEVLAPGFSIISPHTGAITERENLLVGLRESYNARPGIQIWIENVKIHHQKGGVILATYEEWQKYQQETTARISSAWFETASSTPNGLRWLHVHETWISTLPTAPVA
jgi:hypothetical protein